MKKLKLLLWTVIVSLMLTSVAAAQQELFYYIGSDAGYEALWEGDDLRQSYTSVKTWIKHNSWLSSQEELDEQKITFDRNAKRDKHKKPGAICTWLLSSPR